MAAVAMGCLFTTPVRAQVSQSIGNLAPGQSVTLTFEVTINSPLPASVTQISAQGTVTHSGGTLNTDDPDTAAPNDATVTLLALDFDFGDAPDPTFPTLLSASGARHFIPEGGATLYLGSVAPDAEGDGQPNGAATGDNIAGTNDEDGVILPAGFISGQSATVSVIASAAGKVDAWIDWNRDGDWNDSGDQIMTNLAVSAGTNVLAVSVPVITTGGTSSARFRLSSAGNLAPTGQADDGEVEDYEVNLVATVPPAITCPGDITTNSAAGLCAQTVAFSATVTAGVPAPTVTYRIGAIVITSPHAFPIGTNLVTVTAANGTLPDATCSFTVIVVDNELPAITAPGNVSVSTGPAATNCVVLVDDTALGSAVASDNCSVTVNRTGVPSGNLFPSGITIVTYTATDGSGNTNAATQSVTVIDNTPPSITCPANMVVVIEPGETNAVVNFLVSAEDNCSVASTNSVPPSGSTFALGTNTVNSVATDASGNTNTCTFLIVVNRRPTAGEDTLGTVENTAAAAPVAKLLVNDVDLDGDTLTITGTSATSTNGGTVVLNSGTVTYTPVNGFTGEDRFTYTLEDGRGGTNTGTVVVTVTSTNAPSQNEVSIALTPNGRLIQFAGIPGQDYIVQSATAASGPWSNLSPPIAAGPTGIIEYEDTTTPVPPVQFYRTIAAP
jgi:hypothetical protein